MRRLFVDKAVYVNLLANFNIAIFCTNELSFEVKDIAFHIEEELLTFSFNSNPLEAFSSQVCRIINVDNVFFFVFIGVLFKVLTGSSLAFRRQVHYLLLAFDLLGGRGRLKNAVLVQGIGDTVLLRLANKLILRLRDLLS